MSHDRWYWGQKAQQLKFNQLEAARKQAETWRTGLTGVTTILGAVLVVKGRDNVTALAPPYAVSILALFAAALAVLVAATFVALEASSGVPGDECLLNAEDLQAWTAWETLAIYRRITNARRLTTIGICTITLGCGTAWLAPAKPPEAPLVRVDSPEGPVCGRMNQLGDGVLRIEKTGHGATSYLILPLNATIQINVVTAC